MAKINARGAHRVGPTFFTEKTRSADRYDVARVYREAWRLRSDGQVQTRIISTRPADGEEGRTTKHSSGFRNVGRLGHVGATPNPENLRKWLERKGYTIVEESWR